MGYKKNIAKGIGIFFILLILVTAISTASKYIRDTADVVYEETNPKAILKKYVWLKNASARLDALNADIKVYETRQKAMEESYTGTSRKYWDRFDKQQWSLWVSEVAGVKATFNSLAAEYNSKMVQVQYRFANVGELPKGATEPLPREYKPYIIN